MSFYGNFNTFVAVKIKIKTKSFKTATTVANINAKFLWFTNEKIRFCVQKVNLIYISTSRENKSHIQKCPHFFLILTNDMICKIV
jgi:hypothetical protein